MVTRAARTKAEQDTQPSRRLIVGSGSTPRSLAPTSVIRSTRARLPPFLPHAPAKIVSNSRLHLLWVVFPACGIHVHMHLPST
jgi:hypothetical protein